jgi:hypothetical protein
LKRSGRLEPPTSPYQCSFRQREVENVCCDRLDHPDQAHEPTLAVASDDTVDVTYYDFRNDCPGDAELTTDVWFAHSHSGGAFEDTHVAGPFNARTLFDPVNPACRTASP